MPMRRVMRMLLVVLSQQVLAVVVAVRSADDGVDVGTARYAGALERDWGLVIELDEDHGAVDAVVEDRVRRGRADPREVRVASTAAAPTP